MRDGVVDTLSGSAFPGKEVPTWIKKSGVTSEDIAKHKFPEFFQGTVSVLPTKKGSKFVYDKGPGNQIQIPKTSELTKDIIRTERKLGLEDKLYKPKDGVKDSVVSGIPSLPLKKNDGSIKEEELYSDHDLYDRNPNWRNRFGMDTLGHLKMENYENVQEDTDKQVARRQMERAGQPKEYKEAQTNLGNARNLAEKERKDPNLQKAAKAMKESEDRLNNSTNPEESLSFIARAIRFCKRSVSAVARTVSNVLHNVFNSLKSLFGFSTNSYWNPVDNGLRVTSRSLKQGNCGIGPKGFQKGNTCAKGDGDDELGRKKLDDHLEEEVNKPLEDWAERKPLNRVTDMLLGRRKPTVRKTDKVKALAQKLGVSDTSPDESYDEFGSTITALDKWDRVKYGKSTTEAAYDVIKKAKSLGFEQVHLNESVIDKNGEGYNGGEVGMVTRDGMAMEMKWRYGSPEGANKVDDHVPEGRKGVLEYRFIYPTKQQQEVYRKNREWADEAIRLGEEDISNNLEEAAGYLALKDTEKAKAAYERGFKILEERRKKEEEERNKPFFMKLYEGVKNFLKGAWNWITGNGWTTNMEYYPTDNNCGVGPDGFSPGNDCSHDTDPPLSLRKKARKSKPVKVRMAKAGSAEAASKMDEYRGRRVKRSKRYGNTWQPVGE